MASEKHDPLRRGIPLIEEDKGPSVQFMRQWDSLRVLTDYLTSGIENNIVAGTGLDGGGSLADGDVTIDLADTAVTPAAYGSVANIPTFTVDQQGRLTAAGVVTFQAALDNITSTQGDLLCRGASAWEALAAGTATYVLTSNGPGAKPTYQEAVDMFPGYLVTGDDNNNGPEFMSNGDGLPILLE